MFTHAFHFFPWLRYVLFGLLALPSPEKTVEYDWYVRNTPVNTPGHERQREHSGDRPVFYGEGYSRLSGCTI